MMLPFFLFYGGGTLDDWGMLVTSGFVTFWVEIAILFDLICYLIYRLIKKLIKKKSQALASEPTEEVDDISEEQ